MNLNKIIKSTVEVFKRKVKKHCKDLDTVTLTPFLAEEFTSGLKESLCAAGLFALREFIEGYDTKNKKPIIMDETKYHWKMESKKKFLTPFGHMKINRNVFQASSEGKCHIPVDEKWGMVGEFATIEVREMILYTLAHLTPRETKEHLSKCAWFDTSETAIKNISKNMGYFIDFKKNEINQQIKTEEEIPIKTRVLVGSVDGVNILLNKVGTKQGRPTERPKGNNDQSLSSYKNAMVGSISFYGEVPEGKRSPERLSSKYIARMPEDKFPKLKCQFEDELQYIEKYLGVDTEKIILCDGARSIWNYIDNSVIYNDYKKLLDFYHMTEHLSKASEAIFGKKSSYGKLWYQQWRQKMLDAKQAPQNLLQSLQYYASTSDLSKSRQKSLKTEITFFRRNKHIMTYANFLHQGLPIGSGPVEAACKTIVKHRLCRSGMRWSIRGGQHILYLRCYVKSNQWNLFWNSYKSIRLVS